MNLLALPKVMDTTRMRPRQNTTQPPTWVRWIIRGYVGDCHILLRPPSTVKDLSQGAAGECRVSLSARRALVAGTRLWTAHLRPLWRSAAAGIRQRRRGASSRGCNSGPAGLKLKREKKNSSAVRQTRPGRPILRGPTPLGRATYHEEGPEGRQVRLEQVHSHCCCCSALSGGQRARATSVKVASAFLEAFHNPGIQFLE